MYDVSRRPVAMVVQMLSVAFRQTGIAIDDHLATGRDRTYRIKYIWANAAIAGAVHKMCEAMTLCQACVVEMMDVSVRTYGTDRIVDRWTNAVIVTREIVKDPVTFSLAGIAKLNGVTRGCNGTDRIPHVRANTWVIAGDEVMVSLTYRKARIVKMQRIAIFSHRAHRIVVFRTTVVAVKQTGEIVEHPMAFGNAGVGPFMYGAVRSDAADWIIDIGTRTVAGTIDELGMAMAFGDTGVGPLCDLSVRTHRANRVEDVRTIGGAVRYTWEIIEIPVTFGLAGVGKLRDRVTDDHTHRIPDGRTDTGGIAVKVVRDPVAFCEACVGPLERISGRSDGTHRVKDLGANARCVTGRRMPDTRTLRPAGIFKLQNTAISSRDTHRIDLVGGAVAQIIARDGIRIAEGHRKTQIRELQCIAGARNNTNRLKRRITVTGLSREGHGEQQTRQGE